MAGQTKVGGITIEIGGDATELTNALKTINTDLQKTGSALKEVNKLLEFNPNSTEQLADKQSLLRTRLDETRKKLDLLNETYERLSEQEGFDKNSKEAVALRTEISKCEDELKQTHNQLNNIGNDSKEVKKVATEVEKATEKTKSMAQQLKDTGKSIEDVGKKLSVMSAAVIGVGTYGVKEFTSFEAEVSKTAAAMGTTVDQIGDIEKEARRLGETTVFTAQESASAFTILAQAGYDANKQIEVAPNVLNLAAAGGLSMADSAKYLTGTLNGFSKEVKISVDETGELITEFGEAKNAIKSGNKVFTDAGQATQYFADLMAKGATLAKTNVGELGEAMSVTASVASGAFGQSAESVTVALLRLADQNVTATQAGTALNQVMSRLYAPTTEAATALKELGVSAYDSAGNARDVNEVVDELNGKLQGLSAEERAAAEKAIFAQRGLKAFSQMAATSADKTEEFYDALTDINGSAGQQADTMLDNLQGRITLLKSAMSEAGITIGEKLKPTIDNVIGSLRSFTQWFNNLDEGTVETITNIGLLVAAIGPVTLAIGKISSALGILMAHPVIAGIALATTGVAALVTYLGSLNYETSEYNVALKEEAALMKEYSDSVVAVNDGVQGRFEASRKSAEADRIEYNSMYDLVGQLDNYVDSNGFVIEGKEKQVSYIQNQLKDALGLEFDLLGDNAGQYKEIRDQIIKTIEIEKSRAILASYEESYVEATREHATAMANYVDAASKLEGVTAEQEQASNEAERLAKHLRFVESAQREWNRKLQEGKTTQIAYNDAMATLNADHALTKAAIEITDEKLAILNQEVEDSTAAMLAAKETMDTYGQTIEQWGALNEAVASGDVGAMNDAIIMLTTSMKTSRTATEQELYKQYVAYDENYRKMEQAVKDGMIKMSDAELKALRDTRDMAKSEWQKSVDDAYNAGLNSAQKFTSGFTSKKKALVDEVYGIGKNITEGLAKGIKDFGYLAQEAAETVTGSSLRTMRNVGVIKSPSHVTQYFGKMLDLGLSKGLLDNAYLPENAAEDVMRGSLDSFNGNGILTAQRSGFGSSSSTTNNTNVGGMTFIINSQPGQNVQELARQVSIEVQRQINSQKAVFA